MIETKKKIIAIVPARIGSKGVKFKNIKKVKNLTLIQRTINQLKKLKLINTIAISTDSKIIQKIAIKNGIWCKNLRPKSISGDKSYTFEALPEEEKEPKDEKTIEFKTAYEIAQKEDEVYLKQIEELGENYDSSNKESLVIERELKERI